MCATKREFQLFELNIIDDAEIDEVCKSVDVKDNIMLEFGLVEPFYKYFYSLYLSIVDIKIELTKL